MVKASMLNSNNAYSKADAALTKLITDANANGKREVMFNVENYFPNEPGVRNNYIDEVRHNGYNVTWVCDPQFGIPTNFIRVKW